MELTKDQLEEIAELADIPFDNIRTNYSGRGMYGQECVGFVIDHGTSILTLGVAIAEVLSWPRPGEAEEYDLPDFGPAYDVVARATTDSMGLSTILYLPGVTLAEEE